MVGTALCLSKVCPFTVSNWSFSKCAYKIENTPTEVNATGNRVKHNMMFCRYVRSNELTSQMRERLVGTLPSLPYSPMFSNPTAFLLEQVGNLWYSSLSLVEFEQPPTQQHTTAAQYIKNTIIVT